MLLNKILKRESTRKKLIQRCGKYAKMAILENKGIALKEDHTIILLEICNKKEHYKRIEVSKEEKSPIVITKKQMKCQICSQEKALKILKEKGFYLIIQDFDNDFYLAECPRRHRVVLRRQQMKEDLSCYACKVMDENEKNGIEMTPYPLRGLIKSREQPVRVHCSHCGRDVFMRLYDFKKGSRNFHDCTGKNKPNPFLIILAIWEIMFGEDFDEFTINMDAIKLFLHYLPEAYNQDDKVALVNKAFHNEKYIERLKEICRKNDIELYIVDDLTDSQDVTMVNNFLEFLVGNGILPWKESLNKSTQIIKELTVRREMKQMINPQRYDKKDGLTSPRKILMNKTKTKQREKGIIYSRRGRRPDNDHPPKD